MTKNELSLKTEEVKLKENNLTSTKNILGLKESELDVTKNEL